MVRSNDFFLIWLLQDLEAWVAYVYTRCFRSGCINGKSWGILGVFFWVGYLLGTYIQRYFIYSLYTYVFNVLLSV
jgi:hypothetical protein